MSDWKVDFINSTERLIQIALQDKKINQEDEEIQKLMGMIDISQPKFSEYFNSSNLERATIIKYSEDGEEMKTKFDEEQFKSLSTEDKKLVASGVRLELIGYFFMGQDTSDGFKSLYSYYEKMLSLI